jgi:DNA polymerase
MGEQEQKALEGAVLSYAHWWREAGFHTAIDTQPHGWRDGLPAPFWQRDVASAPVAMAPVAPAQIAEAAPVRPKPAGMPADLPGFLEWLAQDATQPEARWDGASILPSENLSGKLLLLVEMPVMGAKDAESLLDPVQRRFLTAMLASIGISNDDAAIAPLAMRRPPGGLLDEATLGTLATRMRHYLSLARPKATIVLGDRMSRALIGMQWHPGAESLQSLDLAGGSMRALALAAPDLLMNRPAAKMRSWQTLRLLPGVLNG